MASYSKVLLVALISVRAMAIDVLGIYSTVCDRSVGILLDVDAANIYFLNLDGNITQVPRYEIASMAVYPTDAVPIRTIRHDLDRDIGYVAVKTKHENEIVPLVDGWPIQFYQDKISFLNKEGQEVVIDRESIWEIDITDTPKTQTIRSQNTARYQFIHPYSQYDCKKEFHGNRRGRTVSVFPEEYISSPVSIKRRLDTIMEHHATLRDYDRQQKFYAVPQVYRNQTSLGYWFSVGSRHGASKNRSNNFTPDSQQRVLVRPLRLPTHLPLGQRPPRGTRPRGTPDPVLLPPQGGLLQLLHVFRPSFMLLGGDKYQWQLDDLKDDGDRVAEFFAMSFGLDFGHFSIFTQGSNAEHGFRSGDVFANTGGAIRKIGFRYQNHWTSMELITGTGETSEYLALENSSLMRYNLKLNLWGNMSYDYSFINRTFTGYQQDISELDLYTDIEEASKVIYEGKSYTNAVYGSYRWKYKYIFRAMLAHEILKVEGGEGSSFFKAGVSANLIF